MDVLVRSCIVIAVLTLAVVPTRAVAPAAQELSVPDVAAAYLVNFVRFTTWPSAALPDSTPLVVCVEGNDSVADSLARLTLNRAVKGRTLSVRRTSVDGVLDACHVFYGANLNGDRGERLIRATSHLPILTVSDSTDFAKRGGVANFFIDDGRMRFSVNPDAAVRARLRISSNLLSLARIVGT